MQEKGKKLKKCNLLKCCLSSMVMYGDVTRSIVVGRRLTTDSIMIYPAKNDQKPTGWFCNGKLVSDITADTFGFTTYPPAFLSPQASGKNLLIGANFASAASVYDDKTAFFRVTPWSVDEIHLEFQRLFPKYVRRMFKFMHEYALNSHFSPRNDVPQTLKYAIPIEKDGLISIPHVLQTSKYIHYLLVRFRSICTSNSAVLLVKDVAEELVASVMKVRKFEGTVYRCATTDIRTMSEMDKAVLKLLRIIYGALHFAQVVATNNASTMLCIRRATQLTIDKFIPYYGTQPFGVDYEAKINGIMWPSLQEVKRLVGGIVVSLTRWKEIVKQTCRVAQDLVTLLQGLKQVKTIS